MGYNISNREYIYYWFILTGCFIHVFWSGCCGFLKKFLFPGLIDITIIVASMVLINITLSNIIVSEFQRELVSSFGLIDPFYGTFEVKNST